MSHSFVSFISLSRSQIIFLLFFSFATREGLGQYVSNIKVRNISLSRHTIKLDSLSLIPHSLNITDRNGVPIDTGSYDYLPYASILVWKKRPAGDSLRVSYRVYPFALANRYFNKDHRAYIKSNINRVLSPYVYNPTEVAADKLIDFGSLDYNGNFSRGLSFGSNQSVVLNSAFNLQLQGMLAKDLEVTAAITDNNIPIQPEGNTQQLQEFDKIFIQLRKGAHTVLVGDFDLNSPQDYFMRYTKKAQGGSYTGEYKLHQFGLLKAHAAAGINKGKFARNTLANAEGNQGPYKLVGTNGETFIIILANSEAVYINGQKLVRGANQDYVIDYNSGTVTFTPRRIITADLRVVVEFQYSERNYQRTMVDAGLEWQTKKVNTFFHAYTEQDSKNSSQQNLDDKRKNFLSAIGDSIDKALYPGVDTASFDVNRILYERHDTIYQLGAGRVVFDTFYVYSTDSFKARYALTFAQVGQGYGDYSPAQNTANGRVYVHNIPLQRDTYLIPTGSYKPVVKLVTPQSQQLFTLGSEYQINKGNKLNVEVALSNKNVNLFSDRDKADNLGAAAKVNYTSEIVTKRDTTAIKQKLNLEFNYEFVQDRFRPIERFRNVEFVRDFNLPTVSNTSYNEHIATASATYGIAGWGTMSYRFRTFIQDTVYRGYENYVATALSRKGLMLNLSSSYLYSDAYTNKSDFIRPKGELSYGIKALKGIKTGVSFDHEVNSYKDSRTDTLVKAISHIWQNYRYYIGSLDTTRNQYRIEYTVRLEQQAGKYSFEKVNRIAHNVNLTGSIQSIKNQTLNFNLTYRRIDERDSLKAAQDLKNYYLGRIDYSFTVGKGLLRSSTLYEVGAGREQKVQLIYLVSPNNTGDYVWTGADRSKPKQLGEFVPLQFRTDTSYLRTFAVTPEYYAVNATTFNQVLNVTPAALLRNAKGFGKLVSKLTIYSSLQLTKKIYANSDVATADYFNPFPTGRMDTNIVALTLNSRNSLYINRQDPKIGGQLDLNYSRSRILLTAGVENRLTQSQGVTVRWNIYKQLNIQSTYTNGLRGNESDYYKTQQYRFVYNETSHELSYLFKSELRVATSYYYGFKSNKIPDYGGQYAVINQVALDMKYNRHNKTTVGAKLSYSSISYRDGLQLNEQARYAMLDGLKNGNNFVWNASLEQRLSTNIQLIVSYDGRKTGIDKPVHTARAELRAIF